MVINRHSPLQARRPQPSQPPAPRVPGLVDDVPVDAAFGATLIDYVEYPAHDWSADPSMQTAHDLHLMHDDTDVVVLVCNNCVREGEDPSVISAHKFCDPDPRSAYGMEGLLASASDHLHGTSPGCRTDAQVAVIERACEAYWATDDVCVSFGVLVAATDQVVFRYFHLVFSDEFWDVEAPEDVARAATSTSVASADRGSPPLRLLT